jgi:hypothetical protein
MSKLRWSATAHGWIGEKDSITVLVSEKTYNERLRTYLASKGIELKTWTEYMRPGEEGWKKQCEAEEAFQEDLDRWLNCTDRGVWVSRPRETLKPFVN